MKSKAIIFAIAIVSLSMNLVASEEGSEYKRIEVNKEAKALKDQYEKNTILQTAKDKTPLTLQNYVLNKRVQIKSPRSLTPLEGGQYVPQLDEFLDLYMEYLANGMEPIEAVMMVHISPLAMEIIKKHNEMKDKK